MEWRTCPQWPEYEVSERGDIRRTLCRFGNIGLRKPYRAANGRLMIAMRHCGKTRACHISRLVLEAFVGPAPSSKHQCAHNDGNPDNNHWSNLRWAPVRTKWIVLRTGLPIGASGSAVFALRSPKHLRRSAL